MEHASYSLFYFILVAISSQLLKYFFLTEKVFNIHLLWTCLSLVLVVRMYWNINNQKSKELDSIMAYYYLGACALIKIHL